MASAGDDGASAGIHTLLMDLRRPHRPGLWIWESNIGALRRADLGLTAIWLQAALGKFSVRGEKKDCG